jgi:hypothetical protein
VRQGFRSTFLPLVRPVAGTIVPLGFVWAWGGLLTHPVLMLMLIGTPASRPGDDRAWR